MNKYLRYPLLSVLLFVAAVGIILIFPVPNPDIKFASLKLQVLVGALMLLFGLSTTILMTWGRPDFMEDLYYALFLEYPLIGTVGSIALIIHGVTNPDRMALVEIGGGLLLITICFFATKRIIDSISKGGKS